MMVFRQSVGSLVRVLAIVGIALDALPVSCHAQMTAGDQTPGAASLSALSDRISDQISNETLGCEEVLPAAQLMHILRNSPEVMVEVKSLVADSAQQTWLSIQADALTDQQVYAQIEGSRELRASIMQFLRARGYVSEEEINTSIDMGVLSVVSMRILKECICGGNRSKVPSGFAQSTATLQIHRVTG